MNKKLSILTLIAFILGIVFGILFPTVAKDVSFLGEIYTNLLKVMIIPVLFTTIVTSLINNKYSIKGLTTNTILLFIIMFVVSFIICCGLWSIIKPGQGFQFVEIPWEGEITSTNFSDFLLNIFPSNIFKCCVENTILPVILFAFAFGLVGKELFSIDYNSYEIIVRFSGCLSYIFQKILYYIMYITPIGVFSLMATTSSTFGVKVLGDIALYVGCAYLGCLIICILVMILPVWIVCKISPISYIKKVYKIWLITLSTCSSSATLPNTIKVCNEEFGIPETITGLVVPLGCTIHMCGGAVSFSLLAMFNMQMLGMPITIEIFIIMLVVALLINMGAPGIPGGGIVIGATYLAALGIPLTFIGFYAGIYRLLDMAYTTMNVTGDITASLLINKSIIKLKDI